MSHHPCRRAALVYMAANKCVRPFASVLKRSNQQTLRLFTQSSAPSFKPSKLSVVVAKRQMINCIRLTPKINMLNVSAKSRQQSATEVSHKNMLVVMHNLHRFSAADMYKHNIRYSAACCWGFVSCVVQRYLHADSRMHTPSSTSFLCVCNARLERTG